MITGNGTADSPYIVTTWGELVETAKKENVRIEFPEEPGDLNIEDEYGRDEPPMLLVGSGVTVDGKGWDIHGLWAKTHSIISFKASMYRTNTIKNLTLSSFYCSGNSFFQDPEYSRYEAVDIDNCRFSGVCEGAFLTVRSVRSGGNPVFTLRNSSVTVQFASADDPAFITLSSINNVGNILNIFNSIVNLTSSRGLTLFRHSGSYNDNKVVWNCFFDLSAEQKIKIYPDLYNGFSMSGCMFTGKNQVGIDKGNAVLSGVNVFNRDAFPDTDAANNFIGLSADEIRDPAYLRSVGFPI